MSTEPKTHVIEVRQPSGATLYVTTIYRDGGIQCRADRAKARRMSRDQAEGLMGRVKQALRMTRAMAYVVPAEGAQQ